MGKLHGAGSGQKQDDPRGEIEIARGHIERCALDKIHDQIRNAVIGHAAIDQPHDIRMIKPRQNAPFGLERSGRFGAEIALDQLDRNRLFKQTVGAFAAPDIAHAAKPDAFNQPERPDLARRLNQRCGHPRGQFGGHGRAPSMASLKPGQSFQHGRRFVFQQPAPKPFICGIGQQALKQIERPPVCFNRHAPVRLPDDQAARRVRPASGA